MSEGWEMQPKEMDLSGGLNFSPGSAEMTVCQISKRPVRVPSEHNIAPFLLHTSCQGPYMIYETNNLAWGSGKVAL